MADLIDEVLDFLYEGSFDPRDVRDVIAKSSPDASEVHVPGSGSKKRTPAENIAYATNAAGMVAGPAALGMAYSAAKGNEGGMTRAGLRRLVRVNGKENTRVLRGAKGRRYTLSSSKSKPTRLGGTKAGKKLQRAIDWIDSPKSKTARIAAGTAGVTAVGLQAANWAGDTIAANMLKNKNKEKDVKKSFEPVTIVDLHDDTDDLVWSGSVSKVDSDKRQVFGWCSLTKVNGEDVVDRQGDYIPLDEVEKSAYNYVIHSRKGGDMHKRNGEEPLHTSDLIESFVVTPEKLESLGLEPDAVPHGWWVGFKVNDDNQWEAVKKGDRAHFSIHGKGRRVEKFL